MRYVHISQSPKLPRLASNCCCLFRRRLRTRMKSSASRAAASAPPAPHNAARTLDERSGVKACRPSSSAPPAISAGPTTNGRGPSKAEHQRDRKITEEVLNLPTEPRAGLPFGRAQGDDHEQYHDGHAAKFQENTHPSPKPDIRQRPNPRYHTKKLLWRQMTAASLRGSSVIIVCSALVLVMKVSSPPIV